MGKPEIHKAFGWKITNRDKFDSKQKNGKPVVNYKLCANFQETLLFFL